MGIQNPLIYIVMPCYNWEKYLLEQLMSIYYQNYTNWYLIFINDWSSDKSENILRDWISHYNLYEKVRVITKENGGVNSAVQRWLEEVKNMCDIRNTDNLVAYCDVDDIWTRDKLNIQVDYMVKHPECDLSYHDISHINENWEITLFSEQRAIWPKRNAFYMTTLWNYITSTEIMFRSKHIDHLLPMPTWPMIYQDYRTSLIFYTLWYNVHYINNRLVYYRRWHSSLMVKQKKERKEAQYKAKLNYFYNLQKKYPEKDFSYIIKYNEDRYINRYNKWYPTIQIYLLIMLKYPKVFIIWLRAQLRRLFKFWKLNPR